MISGGWRHGSAVLWPVPGPLPASAPPSARFARSRSLRAVVDLERRHPGKAGRVGLAGPSTAPKRAPSPEHRQRDRLSRSKAAGDQQPPGRTTAGSAGVSAPRGRGGRARGHRPFADEHRRARTRATTAKPAKAPKAQKPTGKAGRKAAKRTRVGRRRGSGARSTQALALIQAQPGITIPELASAMAIKPNYLYRVLPALQKDKRIAKDGRGWKATS